MDTKIKIDVSNAKLKVHDAKIWNSRIVCTVSIDDNLYMIDAEGYIIFRAFGFGIFPSTLQEAIKLGCSVPIKDYEGLWKASESKRWNSQTVYLMIPDERFDFMDKELNLIINEEGHVITTTLASIGLAELEQEQLYRVTYTYHGKAPREDVAAEDARKLITDGLLRPEVEIGPDQDLVKLCEVYVALLMQSGCDDTTIFQLITEWLGNGVCKDESQEDLEEQAKLLLQWVFARDVQKEEIKEVIKTNGTNNGKSTK